MATATMTAPAVMAAPSRLASEVAEGARSEGGVGPSAAVEPQPAYFGDPEHPDRSIVNAPIGDRERSGALGGRRLALELSLLSP
jgi:hypothetical protein